MLDALDECTHGTLEDIINLICQFQCAGIKVFCTSRPIFVDLRDRLNISTIHSIVAHEEDITNYLSRRLNKEWRHNGCFLEEIIDRLAGDAKGKLVSPRLSIY